MKTIKDIYGALGMTRPAIRLCMALALMAQTAAAFKKLDVSRGLLMNDDTNTTWEVRGQGYYSTNTEDEVYWTRSDEPVPKTKYRQALYKLSLLSGITHTLHWTKPGETEPTTLWQLNKCRAGSAATDAADDEDEDYPSGKKRNFIPWSRKYSVALNNKTRMTSGMAYEQAGMISMLNTTNSWVMSPFYDNIGTIYFDAVNGWTDKPGDIVLEIATNTVDGSVFSANTPTESLEWKVIPFNVFTVKNKTTVSLVATDVTYFTLNQNINTSANLWGNYFYRIRATLNYRYAPIRFRIRRASIDTDYTNEEDATAGNYLILDNIIASYAPIQIDFGSFKGINGEKCYDETRTGTSVVGYEGVFNKIFLFSNQRGACPISNFKAKDNPYVTNSIPSDFSLENVVFYYRWRYLDFTNKWYKMGMEAIKESQYSGSDNIDLSDSPGDLEFYYTLKLTKEPYYEPFDFACNLASTVAFGSGWKELVPMELEFRCGEKEAEKSGITVRTKGRDWFVRIREGESSFRDVVLNASIGNPGDDDRDSTIDYPMELTGNHSWRAYIPVTDENTGKSVKIRFKAVESTQKNRVYSDVVTYWASPFTTNTVPPCSGFALTCDEDTTPREWGETMLDGISGYMMVEYNDSTHSMSITHCEYQNFNLWTDVKGDKYWGTVGTNTYMVSNAGVSPRKKSYSETFLDWEVKSPVNEYWREYFNVSPDDVGYPQGVTFAQGTTPNGWEAENFMYVNEPADTNYVGRSIAVQLEGYGKGTLTMQGKAKMPDGIDAVSFSARVAQFMEFDDFAYYQDGTAYNNYAVGARVAFTRKGTSEVSFPRNGTPSMSLVGYYRSNQGSYECRFTRMPDPSNTVDMAIYRWDRVMGKMVPTMLTNMFVSAELLAPNSSSGGYAWPAAYLALYTKGDATYVTAALANSANTRYIYEMGANNFTNNLLIVKDTSSKRRTSGTFGVGSRECPAVFGRVTRYELAAPYVDPDTDKVLLDFSISGEPDVSYLKAKDPFTEEEWIAWSPGRMMFENHDYWSYLIYAGEPSQKMKLLLRDNSSSTNGWVDVGYYVNVTSYVFTAYSFNPKVTGSYGVRLCAGETTDEMRTDVLIDDVEVTQWTKSGWDFNDRSSDSRWTYSQCYIPDLVEFSDPWAYTRSKTSSASTNEFIYEFNDSCDLTALVDFEVTRLYIVSGSGKLKEVDEATLKGDGFRDIKVGDTIKVTVGKKYAELSGVQFGSKDGNWYTANGGGTADVSARSVVKMYVRAKSSIVRLQPRRAVTDKAVMIKTPKLNGISLFNFSYRDAHPNARLLLQFTTNNIADKLTEVSEAPRNANWTDVTNFTFGTGATSGSHTFFFPNLREPATGYVRLVCDPNLVDYVASTNVVDAENGVEGIDPEYGSVTITKVVAYDEPKLDERSWYGWNMRTTDNPALVYLPDPAADPEGLAGALNFTGEKDDPNADFGDAVARDSRYYEMNDPFVQCPEIANEAGIGQVRFRARMMDPATNVSSYVTIYGADDPNEDSTNWTEIASIEVTNRTFRTFQWKSDADSTPYKTVRLAVKEARHGKDAVDAPARPIQRVLIDEISVMEPIVPGIRFSSIAAFRTNLTEKTVHKVANATSMDQQPLLGESFGIQVEVMPAQLADELDLGSIRVFFSYYVGDEYWGYSGDDGWADHIPASQARCELMPLTNGTDLVWRSAYSSGYEKSIIPSQPDPGNGKGVVVQYYVWAEFKDIKGMPHVHEVQLSDGWKNPSWYYPIDYNEDNGGYSNKKKYCPYTILQKVSPKRVWINCINVFDGNNSDYAKCQFLELAVPPDEELTGWRLRFRENDSSYLEYSVTFATLGRGNVPNMKETDVYNNYCFLSIENPAGTNSADGVWNKFDAMTSSEKGTFRYTQCYGLELLRPNGIIEHQVVFGGTNIWASSPGYESLAQKYDPAVMQEKLKGIPKSGSDWILAGSDWGTGTVGVMNDYGGNESDWEMGLVSTPGLRNRRKDGEGQNIDKNWNILPGGEYFWVRSIIGDGDDNVTQYAGETTGKYISIVLPRKASTNIVYKVTPWHRIGTILSNNVSVAVPPINEATLTYNYNISKIANNVELDVKSCVDPRVEVDGPTGISASDPYHDAVVKWLQDKGENGEIIPAELKVRGSAYTDKHLSLKEMYWLDIDPFETNRLEVGFSDKSPPIYGHKVPDSMIDMSNPHSAITNLRINIYMMITNIQSGGAAHAPYTIQGLGGEQSRFYTENSPNWTSATFKVMAKLHKHENVWRPLRYLVFKDDSFDSNFEAEIEVWDPYSDKSPIYSDLDALWWPYRPEGYAADAIWYKTSIDESAKPVRVETLKQKDYLTP